MYEVPFYTITVHAMIEYIPIPVSNIVITTFVVRVIL
jgi:hypothetical protein